MSDDLHDKLDKLCQSIMTQRIEEMIEGQRALDNNEPVLYGGLTNGFIRMPDRRMIFLTFDPMRQFRSPEEIGAELKELMEANNG